MKILIFGAGGVGSVVGGFLARTGHEVTLLGRAWHLDAIAKNGLTITGIWGDYRIKAFDLCADAARLQKIDPGFDLIILTVKAYDTEASARVIAPLLREKTVVLSLQNGLGNIETILSYVKPESFLAGRVIFGVEAVPGVVRVTVHAEPVHLGSLPGTTPIFPAGRMEKVFNDAKIPALAVPNILTSLWAKVIYNCALNALCTIHEIAYGKILENTPARALMREVVRECYAVAAAEGIALEPLTAQAYIELLETKWIPRTALHHPSMWQDLKRGKRIDIQALNGAIVRLGQKRSIPTPVNADLTDILTKKSQLSF